MNKLFSLETRRHGTGLFPFASYELEYGVDEVILDCHWHSEIEFLLVKEGSGIFQLDDRSYKVNKGEALIIHGGGLHSGKTSPGQICSFEACVFSPDLIRSSGNDHIQTNQIDPVLKGLKYDFPLLTDQAPLSRKILDILREINSLFRNKEEFHELKIKIKLLNIVLLLNRKQKKEMQTDFFINTDKTESIKESLRFIHNNYSKNISIHDMADAAAFSDAHFTRVFKATVHMTPFEYLNFFRINRSAEFLKNSDLPLNQIATMSGYTSVNYYIRCFKKIKNCTPYVFRKFCHQKEIDYDNSLETP